MSHDEPQSNPVTHCINCNYSLAGIKPGYRCPECGRHSPIHTEHLAETLDAFCFCSECGYHLFGINRSDNCPECGQHAARSAIEQSLYRSGASYLHSLRSGYRSVQVGLILILFPLAILSVGQPALRLFTQGTGVGTQLFSGSLLTGLSLFIAMAVGGVFLLVGSISATKQDPHLGIYASTNRTRSATRALAIINFCLYLPGAICMPYVAIMMAVLMGDFALVLFPLLYLAAAVAVLITSAAYSERITQRLGSNRCTRTCHRCNVAIITLVVLVSFAAIAGLLNILSAAAPFLFYATGTAFTITSLACLSTFLVLVSSLAKHLKLAIERGEAIPRTLLKPGQTNTVG